MIYVFGATALYTLIKERKKLLSQKRNLILYLFLSILGLVLGVVYLVNPYLPSLSMFLEKYMN